MVTNPFGVELDNVALSTHPTLTKVGADIAIPIEQDKTQKQPDPKLGTIAAGASVTSVFAFNATNDGFATATWGAMGNPADNPQGVVKGAGVTTVQVDPAQLVSFIMNKNTPAGQGPLVPAGTKTTIGGVITNITNGQVVHLDPIGKVLTGNAGGGNPTDPDNPPPTDAMPYPIAPTLGPGEVKAWIADLQTVQNMGTRASVNYGVTGNVELADGTTRQIADAEVVYAPKASDGTFGAQELISISDAPPKPAGPTDLTSEVAQFSIGFANGGAQWFLSTFQTTAWLLKNAPAAATAITNAPVLFLQSIDYYVTFWAYMSPDARDAWLTSIATGLLAQTSHFGKDLASVKAAISGPIEAWITKMTVAWDTGDYNTVNFEVGQILGNVALEAASWKVHLPDAAELIKLGDKVKQGAAVKRISAGLKALEAGDDLSKVTHALTDLFGITERQVAALQLLAKEKGLLIAARFRSPLSIEWEAAGAVLKSEAIKIKTVNDIDVKFLKYRKIDEGSVVFKQPISLDELHASSEYKAADAIDQQAAEIRLSKKQDEWAKYHDEYFAMDKPLSQGGGVDTAFDNAINGAAGPPSANVVQKKLFKLIEDPPKSGYFVVLLGFVWVS